MALYGSQADSAGSIPVTRSSCLGAEPPDPAVRWLLNARRVRRLALARLRRITCGDASPPPVPELTVRVDFRRPLVLKSPCLQSARSWGLRHSCLGAEAP